MIHRVARVLRIRAESVSAGIDFFPSLTLPAPTQIVSSDNARAQRRSTFTV
jgi:hypothetical protein